VRHAPHDSRRPRLIGLAAGLVLALGLLSPLRADDRTIGVIRTSEGATFVGRAGAELPGREGLALQESDVLRTGPDGRLGVILRDDTRLSLGPDSEVRIDRFAFAPSTGVLALVIRMARGAAIYVSGKIAALSPGSARVETPVATLSTRGTAFAVRVHAE
jgi:hypothetical protein